MLQVLTAFHVFICLILIGVVLLQQGRGADVGATFGGGSNTLFGASGADTFLTKFTTITAVLFMVTSLVLAMQTGERRGGAVKTKLFSEERAATATETASQAASSAAPAPQQAEVPQAGAVPAPPRTSE
jgi:preprotein translocase subunit SecG